MKLSVNHWKTRIVMDHEKYLKQQPVFNADEEVTIDPENTFTVPDTIVTQKQLVSDIDPLGLILSVLFIDGLVIDTPESSFALVSAADRTLRLYDLKKMQHVYCWTGLHGNSAVRCVIDLGGGLVATAGMDGSLTVVDLVTKFEVGKTQAHKRFIVHIVYDKSARILASAGYDGDIIMWKLKADSGAVQFEELGRRKYMQLPTTLAFVPGPLDEDKLVLLACTQDSTVVHRISVATQKELEPIHLVDPEHSLITFTSLHIAVSPNLKYFAIATSHTPHLRVIFGDIESKEVLLNTLAHSPQDHFSAPRLRWSRDGKGVFVTGDDGIVRAIEMASGRIVFEERGHKGKIRDIDIGEVDGIEMMITGGADKRVVVWGMPTEPDDS